MSLASLREELRATVNAAHLTMGDDAEVQVFSVIPEKVTPPFVAVVPDDPYVDFAHDDPNVMYGEVLVRHRLIAVGRRGANDLTANELDALLVSLLRLDYGPHEVGSVGEPGRLAINGQEHLAADIPLATVVRLEDL